MLEEFLRLVRELSYEKRQVTLASGRTSDFYIDMKNTLLHPRGIWLASHLIAEMIKKRSKTSGAIKGIGGLTMGADPVVVAVAVTSGEIHGFLVRKAEKQHGTGQRIEGFREKGARVVIVDDVCTTGASTIQAIEAAREFGFEIAGAMCLVEREEAKGRPNVEKAAAPAPFVSIFTATDVRKEHLQRKDETSPPIFAVAATCELCGRPAVTNMPRNRCEVHKA